MSIVIAFTGMLYFCTFWFVCLSVRSSDYLKNNKRICINLLPVDSLSSHYYYFNVPRRKCPTVVNYSSDLQVTFITPSTPSTHNPRPSTLDPQPLDPRPTTSSTLNPSTHNPSTHNLGQSEFFFFYKSQVM